MEYTDSLFTRRGRKEATAYFYSEPGNKLYVLIKELLDINTLCLLR